jgi:hypothetical protein
MFLEEKIDSLKKHYSADELKVPYVDFKEIMKRIESHFIIKSDTNSAFNNWTLNLKNPEKTYTIDVGTVDFIRTELDLDKNYWWIFVEGQLPSDRHRLFDAKPTAGLRLLELFHEPAFYIVDKKYEWLIAVDAKSSTIKEIGQRKENNNKPSITIRTQN